MSGPKKQKADAASTASAPEFNSRLIVELKRELDVPCGLRCVDQTEGGTGEVGVGMTQLNVVERIQEVSAELEVFRLGKVEIL
jgi:hypothetical protein